MKAAEDNPELLSRLLGDPATDRLLCRWRQSIIELEAAKHATFGDEIEKPNDTDGTKPFPRNS
jgi:hypothetical protein